MAEESLQLYDTTLRDGSQREGMALTVDEKLAVARHLDALGVGFIEGGWPGAVPRDTEFFRRARTELRLRNAQLTAFGATRKAGAVVSADPQVRALLAAGTPVITLVAKSHTGHVERALRTTLAENLAMIGSTVRHLVHAGRRVFLDAEHYFDGHRLNREDVLLVEAGPRQTLTAFARRHRAVRLGASAAVPLLPARRGTAEADRQSVLTAAARLWTEGHDLDVEALSRLWTWSDETPVAATVPSGAHREPAPALRS